MNTKKINLEQDRFIINILGEICWGFQVDNFEKKLEQKKAIVENLLEKLLNEEKAGVVEIYLDNSEVSIIRKAFNEVEKEIEEWEFQTRIGAPLNKVKELEIFK